MLNVAMEVGEELVEEGREVGVIRGHVLEFVEILFDLYLMDQ